jgi:chaperonin GroEL
MARSQRVIFQPGAYNGIREGIALMVNAIRPTLGPLPRIVALERTVGEKPPEMLDDGGVLARRIIQVSDKDQDMGAMLVRQLLWRMHEETGDGTATAAVVLQSIFEQGLRHITAGGNAMVLRRNLEKGIPLILAQLDQMAVPVEGPEQLTKIAESICYDHEMARMLGEIFDIIGEYGQLETRSGRGREMEREYVEGMYWKSQPFSRDMLMDKARYRTDLEDAAILISDLQIEEPRQLVSLISMVAKSGIKNLLIISRTLSDEAQALILYANKKNENFKAVVTKTPGLTPADVAGVLEDVAILTGGRAFRRTAGETLDSVKLEHLGRARKAWADRFNFGIIGGKGDPREIRTHIAALREAFGSANDAEVRKSLRERLGKLLGGSATLWVGAPTEQDIALRKELADRTAEAVRGAVREGVVPGGGVALLECRAALREQLEKSTNSDEQMAYRILIRALEEPIRVIIKNAGHNADEVMAEVRLAGPGKGFDVRSAKVVDMQDAGIFDSVAVQKDALVGAVKTAALALTIDVLVHRKKPPESVNP